MNIPQSITTSEMERDNQILCRAKSSWKSSANILMMDALNGNANTIKTIANVPDVSFMQTLTSVLV